MIWVILAACVLVALVLTGLAEASGRLTDALRDDSEAER